MIYIYFERANFETADKITIKLTHISLDINECRDETNRCHVKARCINTQGSYTCSCNSGFHGDGMVCSDIDECAWGVHDCHRKAKCINAIGSYRCSCLNGYHGNGKQCKSKQVIQVIYVTLYIYRGKAYSGLSSATEIANNNCIFI